MRLRSNPLVYLTALMVIAGSTYAAGRMDELLNNSPFGARTAKNLATTTVAEPLEFRAVLEENGKFIFSFFETNRRSSAWLELNEPGEGIAVKDYDSTTMIVKVEYYGRLLTLGLKTASRILNPQTQSFDSPPLQVSAVAESNLDEAARAHLEEINNKLYREVGLRIKQIKAAQDSRRSTELERIRGQK